MMTIKHFLDNINIEMYRFTTAAQESPGALAQG